MLPENNNCIKDGDDKFCILSSTNANKENLLEETVRQMCIYE